MSKLLKQKQYLIKMPFRAQFTIFAVVLFCSNTLIAFNPSPPTGLSASGYDSHIELNWDSNAEPNLSGYRIYRAEQNAPYQLLKLVGTINTQYIDFIGRENRSFSYKITALNDIGEESDYSNEVEVSTFEMSDEQLLTMVQEYTFRYFWDFAHPASGMARERNTTSIVTSGGSGFGIMAILVGIERGFITHEQGVERLLKIVTFLETADRFHGVFPHWMNGATGRVIPFFDIDDGGDLVETAFLIQGLLTARQCIGGGTPDEILLREKITKIWEEVDWNWYRKSVQNVLFWHWSPNFGWQVNHEIQGFNEAHIIYILAIASPTHPIPASLYHSGWVGSNYNNGNSYYGYPLEVGYPRGGPLFFSHYSYLGFDPRNKKDAYTNYFNRNIYHTLINRAYCIENPENHEGYSEVCWGLTASDDPWGYLAHEPSANRDNGTVTPTAAISSMPYAPELSKNALKHFYRDHGEKLWGKYGFYDAFNLDENWFAKSYLAIDQGPIIGMIENYRSELLWSCFMANQEIQDALDAIGFVPDSDFVSKDEDIDVHDLHFQVYPNPVRNKINIETYVSRKNKISLDLFDFTGRHIKSLSQKTILDAGNHTVTFELSDQKVGVYFLELKTDLGTATRKIVIMN